MLLIISAMCRVPLAIAIPVLRGVISWNGTGALRLCKAPVLVIRSSPAEVPEQVTPMISRFLCQLA